LIPIGCANGVNPVRKACDLQDLILSEEGLPVPKSVAEGNFSRTSPSPKRLPGNSEESGYLSRWKVCDAINFDRV